MRSATPGGSSRKAAHRRSSWKADGASSPTSRPYLLPAYRSWATLGSRLSPCTASAATRSRAGRSQAQELVADAKALEEAGCFAIVLECVPAALARTITANVGIPTIGIGAGPDCDGQVLVYHDLLGMNERFQPRFVKRYAEVGEMMVEALTRYREEVERGEFPGKEHSYE
jgi:ketopantoate hydroxymethyltransferase